MECLKITQELDDAIILPDITIALEDRSQDQVIYCTKHTCLPEEEMTLIQVVATYYIEHQNGSLSPALWPLQKEGIILDENGKFIGYYTGFCIYSVVGEGYAELCHIQNTAMPISKDNRLRKQ